MLRLPTSWESGSEVQSVPPGIHRSLVENQQYFYPGRLEFLLQFQLKQELNIITLLKKIKDLFTRVSHSGRQILISSGIHDGDEDRKLMEKIHF